MLSGWIFIFFCMPGKGGKVANPFCFVKCGRPIKEDENRKNDLADSKSMEEILKTYIGNVMVAEILKYLSEEIDKVGNADIYNKVVQIASSINASKQEKSLMVEDLPHISTLSMNYWCKTSLAEGTKIDSILENGNTSKSSKGIKFLFLI